MDLKKLDRLCLGILVIVTVICGYWVADQGTQLRKQIHQKHDLLTRRLKDLDLAKMNLQGLQAALEAAETELKVLNEKIPENAKIGVFLKNVDVMMTSLNLVMINVKPFPAVREKLYTRIPIHLTFKGSFVDSYHLLWELETMNRLLVMEKITISQSYIDEQCQVDLTASIFQRSEPVMKTARKLL